MDKIFEIIIITLIVIPLGIVLGMGAVYVFNKMPAKWLCDYGEEPGPELTDRSRKRLPDYPAKIYFSMAFILIGELICTRDYVFGFAALFEMWLLLIIALADKKYMIIPDQFVIFLALFAFPLSIYRTDVGDMVYGAILGFGVMMVVALLGRLIMKKNALGFGDVKLMSAIGLTAGLNGTAFVLALTSVISAVYFAVGLMRGAIKKSDEKPLGPFIALSMTAYLVLMTLYL